LLAFTEVVEASARDMQALYANQSSQKTRDLFTSAIGKVLFIDEAHPLGSPSTTESRDEPLDCMMKPEFCGKIVIILAGYDDEMEQMLAGNSGLARRFATEIAFAGSSAHDCVQLLVKRAKQVEDVEAKFTGADDQGEYLEQIEGAFLELSTSHDWGEWS
jgi:hypothetical protein